MGQVMSSDQNRVLHRAILASLVVHGLLLLAFPERRELLKPAEPPPPLLARLVEPEAPPAPHPPPPSLVQPVPKLPPVAEAAPETKLEPKLKPKPKPKPKRKPKPPVAKPAPASEAAVARTAPPAPAEPPFPAVPEVEQRPATAASPPPVVDAAQPAPALPGLSADPSPRPSPAQSIDGALALYRQQLLSTARKYKHYPRVAIDNAWEGDVVVHLVVGADGMIASLTVKSGSGHSVLDRQALDMFRRATPLVEIPAALRGREFALEVRAIYNLKDQGSG
jgi:periplasmic protein TonB